VYLVSIVGNLYRGRGQLSPRIRLIRLLNLVYRYCRHIQTHLILLIRFCHVNEGCGLIQNEVCSNKEESGSLHPLPQD